MDKRAHWVPAYIGLGSNLDEPAVQLRRAVEELGRLPRSRLVAVSSFYLNPPLGPPDQPDYVNAAAALLTALSPAELLVSLQAVESSLGRIRAAANRWGPRRIDLDILAYGNRVVQQSDLQIPHPGISERNFVLFPLSELAPEFAIPGHGIVRWLASRCDGTSLQLVNNEKM